MKKTNLKVLLVALSSVFALAACNNGSSSNPSPAPSPSASPTTSPTPGPTTSPVPPVTTESGIYVQGTGFTYTFSTAPSKGTWYQYTTLTGVDEALAASTSPNGLMTVNATATAGTLDVNVSANGSSFENIGTVEYDAAGTADVVKVITGGTNTVITVADDTTPALTIAAVTPAGVVTQAPVFTNHNGTHTAPALTNTSVVTEFGGTYYLFVNGTTTATVDTVFTSTDGKTWNYAAAPTAGIVASTITQIGSTYYAVTGTGTVVSGTSPLVLATATNLTSNGGVNNDINTAGAVTGLYTDGTNLYVHAATTVYYFGNGVAQQASAEGTLAATDSLMFAGSTVYAYHPGAALTSAGTVKPVTQTGTALDQGTAASVTGDSFAVDNSSLIVANPKVGAAARSAGGIDVVSAISSTGVSTYSVLPVNTNGVGFAGTPSNYMMIGANGAAVLNSGTTLVPVATVLNNSAAGTAAGVVVQAVTGTPAHGALFSNGASYLANTSTGIAVSSGIGSNLTWTFLPTASLPAAVTDVQVANGSYFITAGGVVYQTATPATVSSWVQTTLPYALQTYKYWDGSYYVLDSAAASNMNVGVFNPATGQTQYFNNVLPQPYSSNGNIGYNGSEYAQLQASTANVWTSSSLTGGRSGWTSATATFQTPTGVTITDTFNSNPGLYWTGAAWVANDASATAALIMSTNGSTWAQQAFDGAVIPATGVYGPF